MITKEELKKEEKYLEKVVSVIQDKLDKSLKKEERLKSKTIDFKNLVGTEYSNKAQSDENKLEFTFLTQDVAERVERTDNYHKRNYVLKRALNSPYFGRVDFKIDDEIINVYVGLKDITDDKHYVFDWRSPIASLFYNYGVGKAEYEAFEKVEGEIILKRQYKIEGSKLVRCIETSLNIDDDVLQDILSENTSSQMTNIVNTIQKEQNLIIRNDKDKVLIVEGASGSGKTSVALHRIAYLLYHYKDLSSDDILIFSPSETFADYISLVLPSLGEENVVNITFNSFVHRFINIKIEDYNYFLKRLYTGKVDKNKFTEEYTLKLENYLNDYISGLEFEKGFGIKNIHYTKEMLNEHLNKYKKLSLNEMLSLVATDICYEIKTSLKNKNKIIENLKPFLNKSIDYKEIYENFINEKIAEIKYEDVPLILYTYFYLNGFYTDNKIKHVVIDEAQDYSLLQYLILKNIFPKASFTILGDPNQVINPCIKYNSLSDLTKVFENGKFYKLSKTYRSSAEITNFTNKILDLNNISVIRRSNQKPVVAKKEKDLFKDLNEDLSNLENYNAVAIITKTKEESKKIYNLLKDNFDVSLDSSDHKKILILPFYMAKGLEFDSVIIYTEVDNAYTEEEKNFYYVACTRAMHELIVYNQKEW